MRILQVTRELLFLALHTKPWRKTQFVSKTNAVAIRQCLERLGLIFVKFGQMMALRPDFVPEIFCEELYKLLDQVPPFPSQQALDILQQELGDAVSEFKNFENTPLASASFSQVHKAVLKNGDMVAVKIQRPDIEHLIAKDLQLMKFLAKIVDTWFRPANSLTDIVKEFEVWTKEELDYSLESSNIATFNTFADLVGDGIRGPRVYKDLTTSKVLTMEFIEGCSLNQIISLIKEGKQQHVNNLGFTGEDVIKKLVRNMLQMSHIHGFFHADPHPANIMFTSQKELVLIDFGIVGKLQKKERVLLLRYFRNMLVGNADESFDSLVELCGNPQLENREFIRQEYRLLVDKFVATFNTENYLEQQIKSGPILTETLRLLQHNGLEVPVSIVRYFKAFETVEGLIFALFPQFQVRSMLKEYKRISIMNIIDSLSASLLKNGLDSSVLKLIDSMEKSTMQNT